MFNDSIPLRISYAGCETCIPCLIEGRQKFEINRLKDVIQLVVM